MDNDSYNQYDQNERESSTDGQQERKKQPKVDSRVKKSARKSKLHSEQSNDFFSKSRPKIEKSGQMKRITDYLSSSTTFREPIKEGLTKTDERQAKLDDLDRRIQEKQLECQKQEKKLEMLKKKAQQEEEITKEIKAKTRKVMIPLLRQQYDLRFQERLKIYPQLGTIGKNASGNMVFTEGSDFAANREKQQQIKSKIGTLEEAKRKHRSKSDLIDKQDIEVKLQMLNRQLQETIEGMKFLNQRKAVYISTYKTALYEQESRFCKEGWPLIKDRYLPLQLLGKGGFSQVYKGLDLDDMTQIAIKLCFPSSSDSNSSKNNYMKHITREYSIHRTLNHPNIVKMNDVIKLDQYTVVTVLELCDGSDLSEYLKRRECLEEIQAKQITKQILSALQYLQSLPNKVIHYDLKPQNIMLHDGIVKLVDFGLCKVNDTGESKMELTSQGTGTYWYLPPETFDRQNTCHISNKVDIWSAGVIFYQLLYGRKPLGHGINQNVIFEQGIIANASAKSITFPSTGPKGYEISERAKNFIKEMLEFEQEKRITISQACRHPYFKKA